MKSAAEGAWRRASLAVGLLAVLVLSSPASAQDDFDVNPVNVVMGRFTADSYTPGSSFQIQIRLNADGNGVIQALGLRETLPPGWSFAGLQGVTGDLPAVAPSPGTTGMLEFAWITIPRLPYTFNYQVDIPADDGGGPKVIHGQLEYRLDGPAQFAAPVITSLNGKDTQRPTITLNGGTSVNLRVGDGWTDPGYTARDNVDGDITSRVQVSGNLNANAPGSYVLSYSVSDSSGNTAVAQRTVRVVSQSGPVSGPDNRPRPGTGVGGIGGGGSGGVGGGFGGPIADGDLPGTPAATEQKQSAASTPATNTVKAATAPQTPATASAAGGGLAMRPSPVPEQPVEGGLPIPRLTQAAEATNAGAVSENAAATTTPEGSASTAAASAAKAGLSDAWPELDAANPVQLAQADAAARASAAGSGPPERFGPQGPAASMAMIAAIAGVCLFGLAASYVAARKVYGGRRRRAVPPKGA